MEEVRETTILGVPIDLNVSSTTISYNEDTAIKEAGWRSDNETMEVRGLCHSSRLISLQETLPIESVHLNSSELLSNSTRTKNILILVVLTSNDIKEYGRALGQ